jgi:hypothetical protein
MLAGISKEIVQVIKRREIQIMNQVIQEIDLKKLRREYAGDAPTFHMVKLRLPE